MPVIAKWFISWGVLIVMGIIGVATVMLMVFSPVDPQDSGIKQITIPKGASIAAIADQLEEQRIVRSSLILRLMLRGQNSVAVIQSGSYELSPSWSVGEIAEHLLAGSKDRWVTLLEGWRIEEMAEELAQTFEPRYFDPSTFLQLGKTMEGHLFPDTYLFPKQTSVAQIVDMLLATFEKKYNQLVNELGEPELTQDQTVVLASLVEREAKDLKDKKIVAGILLNRLRAGIPLQVDATLQYIKGYDAAKKTWWPQPRAADKDLKSLFNTYAHRGLPPLPICNPGINALRAAIAPTESNYYYYLTDNRGVMRYARTLAEHNSNVNTYLR